ncbi:protein of unknown function [Xenorhabdus poinarii G6]|uniref:Uncharacterized protein n=1 Tax=Xenorhabdus poinarii G6 TaxID=1354304 RepID=A0A068R1B2_9GAMM|nr:protein of unknown function [Xenorhabdus poinarii G6]
MFTERVEIQHEGLATMIKTDSLKLKKLGILPRQNLKAFFILKLEKKPNEPKKIDLVH